MIELGLKVRLFFVSTSLLISTQLHARDFSQPGHFHTQRLLSQGPEGKHMVVEPNRLNRNHGVLVWGNGRGMATTQYAKILDHMATHGFIVVASNSRAPRSAVEMLKGLRWIMAQSNIPNSKYAGRLSGNACAFGHSNGARGTINAGSIPAIHCTAPIFPDFETNSRNQKGPMFLIAGASDFMVPVREVRKTFRASNVPTIFGIMQSTNHFAPVDAPSALKHYLVAWFKIHLENRTDLRPIFFNDACEICTDRRWRIERKSF